MPRPRLALALLLLPLLAAAGLAAAGAAHASLILSKMVDPPLLVSNNSGREVTLTWQTSLPGTALTAPRSATIAAGAMNQRVEPGVTWIVERMEDGKTKFPLENLVYVSRMADGQYVTQAVLKSDIFVRLTDLERMALQVTIDADGKIALAPTMVE